jgi:uncharacterized membrane protein
MPQIGAIVYDSAMAFERRYQPLLSRREFVWRYVRWITVALIILTVSLAAGVCGYHFLEGIPWIDSLLNASMILGGMGPVDTLKTKAGKLFASFYALYSGLLLISLAGLMLTPLVHRFLHRFHLELDQADGKAGKVRAGKATIDDD